MASAAHDRFDEQAERDERDERPYKERVHERKRKEPERAEHVEADAQALAYGYEAKREQDP